MTLADAPRVHEIDQCSFSLPWPERSYRYEVTGNPHAMCWVAEVDLPATPNLVVGMIVTWLILDEAHIATLAVHPDFRSLGIGRRLLARSLEQARERGAVSALLEVRASNLTAQALYAQFGFVVDGVRPRYYQDNHEDALLMSAKILLDRVEEQDGPVSGDE